MSAFASPAFSIHERCFGCGACASLAPGVFVPDAGRCRVARQPDAAELAVCQAALLNCPASAIKAVAASEPEPPASASTPHASAAGLDLYASLSAVSEAVRWQLAELPWHALEPAAATPELRTLVREMAFSEHATYSATQRFLQSYYDDVELSSWLAVWFYEETRHPHVLARWLHALGERFDDDMVRRGRVSTPFMKSKIGTLVTNLISELTAAHAYAAMASFSPEPLLAAIARRIAGDEARHASAFFLFARRMLEREPDRSRAMLDALKVLHVWLDESGRVTHPINQMTQRLAGSETGARVVDDLALDFGGVRRRATRLVGTLLELPLTEPGEVLALLQQKVAEAHRRG
jgi:ferredoxin